MERIICILGVVKNVIHNFALMKSAWTFREGDNSLMYSISIVFIIEMFLIDARRIKIMFITTFG